MKNVKYFRTLDSTRGWGDPLEGVTAHLQSDRTRLVLKSKDRDWQVPSVGPILLHNHDWDRHHLFCLAAAHEDHIEAYLEHNRPIFSPKFLEDNDKDHVLMVLAKPFMERLEQGASANDRKFDRGLVIYYDQASFHGDASPFHKKSELSWQQELRVLFEPTDEDFLEIDIPSLEDVSVLIPAREANSCLTIRGG
jgi:hypothetical protein